MQWFRYHCLKKWQFQILHHCRSTVEECLWVDSIQTRNCFVKFSHLEL
jgi:hypothetical protein